ncbi:hypothetical protein D1159_18390, partial [Pseudoflavonifractor sp. 524-17]|uniref:S-layer homology domain-containing protein n=1 Tax=Pseudoflavonifractor sp. 524-17 TaxID=2304577 RepID=UPI00192A2BD3
PGEGTPEEPGEGTPEEPGEGTPEVPGDVPPDESLVPADENTATPFVVNSAPAIPGYTTITAMPLDETATYIIVAVASDGTAYALHLNADGTTGHGPGATAYPDCTATLTISDGSVTAVRTSDSSAALTMDNLGVTIAPTSGGHTIKNATHSLSLAGQMFDTAANAPAMTDLTFVNGRFQIYNSTENRYLTFNVANDESAHFPAHPTGFCGFSDDQNSFLPIYLYQKEGTGTPVRERLQNLVDQFSSEGLNEADYLAHSWSVYADALTAAQDALGDAGATDEALYTALADLQSAHDALQLAPELPEPSYSTVYQLHTGALVDGVYAIYTNDADNGRNRILYHTGTGMTDKLGGSVSNDQLTLNSSFAASRQLWTLTAVDGGYTLQSVDSSRYLDLTEASEKNINTSASAVVLTITSTGDGTYTVSQQNGQSISYDAANNGNYFAGSEAAPLRFFKQTEVSPEFVEDWRDLIPAPGTTTDQPFNSGTGGSGHFRIPAITTITSGPHAGRLVAAIDARWTQTGDGANIDTLFSYSDDNGKTWHYSFANYFGDSTDVRSDNATNFIDPVIVADNSGTLYLMVDIFPGGVALNTAPMRPATATGYVDVNGTQRLALYLSPVTTEQTDDNYAYYIGDFDASGYAAVYERGSNADSGFYVDEYYYLYQKQGGSRDPENDKIYCERLGSAEWIQQNVFFYNASLHVRNVSYLWIVKSTDGGETWSVPIMNNHQVRTGEDKFYGVGPGAGLCMKGGELDGMILLPTYTHSNEHASFIYTRDGGATWIRGPVLAEGSSESCLVQIDETTIRHFFRDGWANSGVVRYVDHTWSGSEWVPGDVVRVEAASRMGSCQISATKYSQQIDGKDVILVSVPGSTSGRLNGRIYAFTVNNDAGHTMELISTYEVTKAGEAYAYSSLTVTQDGQIALLCETVNGNTSVPFHLIPFSVSIPDASFTDNTTTYDGQPHSITAPALSDEEYDITYSTDNGSTWSSTLPTFTEAGTYTVQYKVASKTAAILNNTVEGSATLTIKPQPINVHLTADNEFLIGSGEVTFTATGIPDNAKGTVTVRCLDDQLHDPHVMAKQGSGENVTYTFTHMLEGPVDGSESRKHTFEATYNAVLGNYTASSSGVYTVTVHSEDPNSFPIKVYGFDGDYDGQAHSITVEVPDYVNVTYCETEDGVYQPENFSYTAVGEYTVYFKATLGDQKEYAGSSMIRIDKANPLSQGIIPSKSVLTGADFASGTPLTLTIPNAPSPEEGTFTLSCDGVEVERKSYDPATRTWTATPNLPLESRSYTFKATFEPNAANVDNYNSSGERTCIVTVRIGTAVQIGIAASPASLTGGGSVTLSVTGVPDAGTVNVTCDIAGITITPNGDGTYTAVLPNTTRTYTFRANYTGQDGYEDATAQCTVSVTAKSSGGGSSSDDDDDDKGSSSGNGTKDTETVTKNPDGSVTTTHTDGKTGTVTATTERPDGGKEILETRKDGTVISTTIDPEGGKVEKVTGANKDIAITVSDSDGKTLAHVALPSQIPPPEKKFVDVPKNHWAEQGINEMASLGVINGVGNDRYNMNANLQRGDLATMLFRLSNGKAEHTAAFEDVPANKYYADGVAWANAVGVVRGDGKGRFFPENSITREELAVVLFNYANLLHLDTTVTGGALNGFTDRDQTNRWAEEGMAWCIENGILFGKGGGILDPGAKVTRAETAVMLQRFLKLVK